MKITVPASLRNDVAIRLLLALTLLAFWPRPAFAHAGLKRSLPASDAEVTAPAQIDLWFNELLEDGFNSVTVISSGDANLPSSEQRNLAQGTAAIDPHDKTHLTIKVNALRKGSYTVAVARVVPGWP